ncbi:MAG: translation initiation factor IF-2 [Oscillospiraceae bacterium]|nr:translation initiation factor IF-2 [Oscillospiraceae bacterium]
MLEKIRIKEVAIQLGTTNKDIVDLLAKYFDGLRNLNSILQEAELDVIFEHYTRALAVESFDSYFALMEHKPKAPSAPEAAPVAEENAPAAAAEQTPPPPEAPAQPAAAAQPAAKQPNAPQTPPAAQQPRGGKPPQKQPNQPQGQNQNQSQNQQRRGKPTSAEREASLALANAAAARRQGQQGQAQPGAAQQPPKKKKEGVATTPQSRTKGEARTVDTRSGTVNLEKYNERYEQIAPGQQNAKKTDTQTNKQKLNQKSRQYRRQGMRSSHRETESERLRRIAAERARKPQLVIRVGEEITVSELALLLKRTATEVIQKLFGSLGVMAAINDAIDYDTAELVAQELGARVEREVIVTIEDRIIDDSVDSDEALQLRDPVVVVMGHVDHGKTSLLDAIRDTAVTETEAGGITQHIGAYRVDCNGRQITFLDTPGHAAFTAMRARGAQATDIAILVVAADDGIMPQTVEAINHAKAAGVAIVVAINKMDKPGAEPDRVRQQLTEYELVDEQWGGETICVPVSAKSREGLEQLLEAVLLVAEMRELRANPNRAAKGVVIEARLDKSCGPIATVLVQNGTLRAGDIIVAGESVGRVRVMTDDKGKPITEAGPSVPVEIMGMAETPHAGDSFDAVTDERLARELVEQRKHSAKEEIFRLNERVTLENLFDSLKEGERKDLNIIVKADVQGSAEAVKQNLLKLSNEEVRVQVIHSGVGAVSESDVMLAAASGAVIVGFNVSSDPVAASNAERDGVQLRTYRVIYNMIEDVQAAVKGMLAPKYREAAIGRAEVRQVVKISSVGNVAGSYILDGKAQRGAKLRVLRDGKIIAEDEISSLRRFKDDVKEVNGGYECGISLNKYADFREGDIFEMYVMEEYRD